MVKLGQKVTDRVTKFKGIAVSRTEYLHGCARVGVQSEKLHEGKPAEPVYIDELQLVENVPAATDKTKGGPGNHPAARSVPASR